jgi:hypothetical protein
MSKILLISLLSVCSCVGAPSFDGKAPINFHPKIVIPSDAYLVHCQAKDPIDCFESVTAFCHQDTWHQVAEGDYTFPAMVQEDNGWRFVVACE